MALEAGQKVVWSHALGATHGEGSILRADADLAGGLVGRVVGPHPEVPSWYVVRFSSEALEHPRFEQAAGTHPDADCLTLTKDELVRVSEG